MKLLAIVLLIALCVPAVAADILLPADPDFTWGAKCPAEAQSSLELARTKWRDAASVPTSPACLRSTRHTRIDEQYLGELVGRSDQGQVAYNLLDCAMAKLKSLDECKDQYARSVSAAGASVPESAKRFDDSYYLLRSRIKLAMGLARAAISRQLTEPSTSNYCFQAMESSIDALRNAADDAQKVPGGAKRAESIRKFRSILFGAWEQAQRSKDTNAIGEIDLTRAFDVSGLLSGDGRAQSRL